MHSGSITIYAYSRIRIFSRAAWNNLAYAAGTIAPSLVLALALALALRETNRFSALLRTMVVMPLLIPLVAAAALFNFILLPDDGLLDFYLHKLGIGMVNWLGDPDTALGAVIAITVWKNTGYYMLFFLAATGELMSPKGAGRPITMHCPGALATRIER